ncbi:DUF547 domain-containing protein [Psychroserpens algicola]|uniref:DUF547 domain-containing protein n=1 Tax=Psychroserpens algicola TaxID=1719034 RepID=UPI0019534B5A|nr:DUF547 domain-containing protein [Psychroserpens algicola]
MRYLLAVLLLVCTYSCFSAKGLPIKEVKAPKTTETETENINSTSNTSTTEALLDHSSWDALLKIYVAKNGDVDYKGFQSDAQKLDEYINYLASKVPTNNWSLNEQLAYFINVYNANTIKLIIDNYPTKSIKDISNPWMKNRLKIGDEDYSLADIENGILRKMNEPRIHFAINCASYSCPKLLNTAYTTDNVQELMERATKEFINNSEKNKLSAMQPKLSEIFKWYKSDFTENGSLIDYINQYAETKISAYANIDYIDYDWNLNEQN